MKKVLFICIHNSARSQMAEAYVNHLSQGKVSAESAGLKPGVLNPHAVAAMNEEGIDISRASTDAVMDFYNEKRVYDYVITVCDAKNSQECPVFPASNVLHWDLPDPSARQGSREEILTFFREVRNEIKKRVTSFLSGLE